MYICRVESVLTRSRTLLLNLQGCGKVLEVRMPRYQDSGRPRGYAHLDFKKAESLEKAIGLNGSCLILQSALSRTYHLQGSITAGSPFVYDLMP